MSFWRTKNNKKITSDSIAVKTDGTTLKEELITLQSGLDNIDSKFGVNNNILDDLLDLNEIKSKFPFVRNTCKILPFRTATLHQPVTTSSFFGFCIYYWGGNDTTLQCVCFRGDGRVGINTHTSQENAWSGWTLL